MFGRIFGNLAEKKIHDTHTPRVVYEHSYGNEVRRLFTDGLLDELSSYGVREIRVKKGRNGVRGENAGDVLFLYPNNSPFPGYLVFTAFHEAFHNVQQRKGMLYAYPDASEALANAVALLEYARFVGGTDEISEYAKRYFNGEDVAIPEDLSYRDITPHALESLKEFGITPENFDRKMIEERLVELTYDVDRKIREAKYQH